MAITIWVDSQEIIDWLEKLRGKVYERIEENDTIIEVQHRGDAVAFVIGSKE